MDDAKLIELARTMDKMEAERLIFYLMSFHSEWSKDILEAVSDGINLAFEMKDKEISNVRMGLVSAIGMANEKRWKYDGPMLEAIENCIIKGIGSSSNLCGYERQILENIKVRRENAKKKDTKIKKGR